MTRKDALNACIRLAKEQSVVDDSWNEVAEVLAKMVASIEKQADKPKGKTTARIQNESYAREFIAKLTELEPGTPVNAKWIADNVRFVSSPQRGTHVAKIAEEWGAISTVSVKNRTYYVLNEDYTSPQG